MKTSFPSAAALALLLGCATPRPEAPTAPPPPQQVQPQAQTSGCGDPSGPAPGSDPRAAARAYVGGACGVLEAQRLTADLVAFPTVREAEPPSGPAFVGMAGYLEAWAKREGLEFRSVDGNEVLEIDYGTGPVGVAFLAHGDVVPAGEGWTRRPFEASLEGDTLYGRGTEDDKGPIAAALVVMRALKRAGYRPNQRVQLIIGMGEEHEWAGMIKYAQTAARPRHVISLDANFPVVAAEAGFVAWTLTSKDGPASKAEKCARVTAVRGGTFLTQVPPEAFILLEAPAGEAAAAFLSRIQTAADQEQAGLDPRFRVKVDDAAPEKGVQVWVTGQSVHSSVAMDGANPLWPLSRIAERANVCRTGAGRLLRLVAAKFDGDHHGQKLGLAHEHPVMGKLLVAPTVLRMEKGVASLGVNMRRPAGMSNEAFGQKLDALTRALDRDFGPLAEDREKRFLGEPHLADLQGELVPTLLQIYSELTGEKDPQPVAIRGGTYARLFPGAVSFGPALPGQPYRGHAPDEAIELSTLKLLLRANLEAVLRLDPLTSRGASP
jgi:predicted dipeptidase